MRSALEIGVVLKRENVVHGMGVASGRMFCGYIGNRIRREYTVNGLTVNIAARLATLQKNTVMCDRFTQETLRDACVWREHGMVPLKGMRRPLKVVEPIEMRSVQDRAVHAEFLIGRVSHKSRIDRFVRQQVHEPMLILSGPPGVGKSTLVRYATTKANGLAWHLLEGSAEEVDCNTVLYPWRRIFSVLFREFVSPKSDDWGQKVDEVLQVAQLQAYRSLVNQVLPIGLPSGDDLAQQEPEIRSAKTVDVLATILEKCVPNRTMIVLEDAQWFDNLSWRVLDVLFRRQTDICFILTHRPFAAPPGLYPNGPSVDRLNVSAFSTEEVDGYLRHLSGANTVESELVAFIHERSGGNPFFLGQLAQFLIESGQAMMRGEKRHLSLNDDLGLDELVNLPATLEAALMSRFDLLTAEEKIILRLAACVGRNFTLTLLENMREVVPSSVNVQSQLEKLRKSGFVTTDASTERGYYFSHALMRETIHDTVSIAQRISIHGEVARTLLAMKESGIRVGAATLAYHYRQAHDWAPAIQYLLEAGATALEAHVNRSAIYFYQNALGIYNNDQCTAVQVSSQTLATWHQSVGDASFKLAEFDTALDEYNQALRLHGHARPSSTTTTAGSLVLALVRQVFHFCAPRVRTMRLGQERQSHRAAAHIYQRVAEIAYFTQDMLELLHANFKNVNHAELSDDSEAMAHAYGSLAIASGLSAAHPIARAYCRRAESALENITNTSVESYTQLLLAVYYFSVSRWNAVNPRLELCFGLAAKTGDLYRFEMGHAVNAMGQLIQGHNAGVHHSFQAIFKMEQTSGSLKNRCWALDVELLAACRESTIENRLEEIALLERSPWEDFDAIDRCFAWAVLARVRWEIGDFESSADYVLRTVALMRDNPPIAAASAISMCSLLETLIALTDQGIRVRELEHCLNKVMLIYRLVAFSNPVAKVGLMRLQGWLQWRHGKTGRAMKKWENSRKRARLDGHRFDEALANWLLAGGLNPDKAHSEKLRLACDELAQLDCLGGARIYQGGNDVQRFQ